MYAMAILGVVASLFASPTFAPAAPPVPVTPPTEKITIQIVTVNGTGCPLGTAAVAVSPDNEAFTVTFSQYLAATGPGYRLPDARRNCQLNLKVNVPSGFTYAIASADYRGYMDLAPGATALERANYYFQGQSPTMFMEHPFTSGDTGDWIASDQTDLASVVYAPCGEQRLFNVNTELRVNAGTSPKSATSYISMDSADGAIATTYHFTWLHCPVTPPHAKK
jgi:hypothetical protein